MNCKLAGREQLAAQGVSERQVHKGVAGGSQRRGSVASPVMIGADWKSAEIICSLQGASGRTQHTTFQVVYSCALFQRGSPRAAALEAIMAVSGLRPLPENRRFRRTLFP